MRKQIPILFSAAMVQSILAGRKTVTRRIAKDIPDYDHFGTNILPWGLSAHPYMNNGKWFYTVQDDVDSSRTVELNCPYGQPGDILWVREEHYRYGHWIEEEGVFTKTGRQKWKFVSIDEEVIYEPPEIFRKGMHHKDPYSNHWHKRLARFMPKYACRIWLERTNLLVERLNDITEEQAIEEGLAQITKDGGRTWKYGIPDSDGFPGTDDHGWPWSEWEEDPREAYFKLWDKINGKESREANPWVWAPGFKVLSTTSKPVDA